MLKTLDEACQKTGWQIHAWCLMSTKVDIARRLRTQTTLTLSQIANLLKMGSWSYTAHLIYKTHDKTTNNED